jgi:hypothetical protein
MAGNETGKRNVPDSSKSRPSVSMLPIKDLGDRVCDWPNQSAAKLRAANGEYPNVRGIRSHLETSRSMDQRAQRFARLYDYDLDLPDVTGVRGSVPAPTRGRLVHAESDAPPAAKPVE